MHWKRITVIGVGLLGGSLGLALKQRRLADKVVGYVRRRASVTECEGCGAVDQATCDLRQAVAGAELVILCTPLAQMRALVEQMWPALQADAVVTDVGSVKASVIRNVEGLVAKAGAHFIGSHPMAGAEKMGVSAARADLFDGAACVLTPTQNSEMTALETVRQLWQAVGARLLEMPPDVHDELVSRSSHLPHVVAAQLASFVLGPEHPVGQAALCANGFRDTTRLAASSPEMWRDIALANRHHLSSALGTFLARLEDFNRALQQGDEDAITRFFETARQRRDAWSTRIGS